MRPFGISFIIGGFDRSGARLFETEPSGALAEYNAVAIGKNKAKAMDLFEKKFKPNLTFDQAMPILLWKLRKDSISAVCAAALARGILFYIVF